MTDIDTSNAQTEATASYKTRQDALDKQIRVATVAHNLLGKLVDGTHGDLVLGALYGDMAHNTRPVHRVPDAAQAVRDAAQRGVGLSVAAIQSDFEWACRDLLVDALEFWPNQWNGLHSTSKIPGPAPNLLAKRGWAAVISEELRNKSSDDGYLVTCYSLLGLSPTDAGIALLPAFDFFRRCRNRIIHQDGTAGRDLSAFSSSTELKKAFKSLAASAQKMAPPLPVLGPQDHIALTPAHAILFLVVARTLYLSLAARVSEKLDPDGYLRMAAHYAYGVSHHPFRKTKYKHVVYPARSFLAERYHVVGPSKPVLVDEYRRLGLWDSLVARYNTIFKETTPGTRPKADP